MKLSIVIQGPVLPCTPSCVANVRQFFPNAELILSTWEGTDTSKVFVDKVVLSGDPGGHNWNIKRQIVSSYQGLQAASEFTAMKIRTDIRFFSTECLEHFDKWEKRSHRLKTF